MQGGSKSQRGQKSEGAQVLGAKSPRSQGDLVGKRTGAKVQGAKEQGPTDQGQMSRGHKTWNYIYSRD